jgi:hypothetical protein
VSSGRLKQCFCWSEKDTIVPAEEEYTGREVVDKGAVQLFVQWLRCMGSDLQPDYLADRLLNGLGPPQLKLQAQKELQHMWPCCRKILKNSVNKKEKYLSSRSGGLGRIKERAPRF